MFAEAFVIWERTKRPAPHRKCKYTVSLLMRVFSVPLLARSIASDTLRDFVSSMLLTLIDARVLEIQEGGNLMKVRQLVLHSKLSLSSVNNKLSHIVFAATCWRAKRAATS